MSHQTGIKANDELKDLFSNSKSGDIRVIKVNIENESLVPGETVETVGNWEDDYDTLAIPLLEEKMPCYIMYRLDSTNDMGYEWVYICWSPDHAHIRQKMLYAGTRATLKNEFGGGQIKEELFGTTIQDVNLQGYKKHLVSQDAPAPLTIAEEELQEVKRTEVGVELSVDSKHQTMQGVSFPIEEDALNELHRIKDGEITYVQLALDLGNEKIILDKTEDQVTADSLGSHIPSDHARYHFFRFKHTHEGDYTESIVFIYSMPGYKCPIRERMLYSSCKSPLVDIAERSVGMEIARKLEIDSGSELTEQSVYDEVHPKKDIIHKKFDKPRGPAGRGARRITKPKQNGEENGEDN